MNHPSQANSIRVAIDIGGTFTDLVYYQTDGKLLKTAKVDSTPSSFDLGVFNVLAQSNICFPSIEYFVHGSTIIINALTEKKGDKVGLITTKGFRDVLEIARGNRPDFFNLDYIKPPSFIPRHLRLEISGRISHKGEELTALNLDELHSILKIFQEEKVKTIAICLINSYVNPIHEKILKEEISKLCPEMLTICSYQITGEWREYERTNTTALCAYVKPIIKKYLDQLENELNRNNYFGPIYLMQSNGGVETVKNIRDVPITMIESGPASGMFAVGELGKLLEEKNLIGLDIGGTTAKCSLLKNGNLKINSEYYIGKNNKCAGYPIMVPTVDILEIGNGGGSIAWIDDFNHLQVGPHSAGAFPGPIAYDKGGQDPTPTDANLILGRINPENLCGGKIVQHLDRIKQCFEPLAKKLNMNVEELAKSILTVANNNMINAIKLISINRGYDPRDFTLVAFGGGGGMHAAYLALELGIDKIIIPRFSSVFSSWGMLVSDLRKDFIQTVVIDLQNEEFAAEKLCKVVEKIENHARGFLKNNENSLQLIRFLRIRYQNQAHSLEILLSNSEITVQNIKILVQNFETDYQREFQYLLKNNPLEIVGIHLIALSQIPQKLKIQKLDPTLFTISPKKTSRKVNFSEFGCHNASIFNGELLPPKTVISGPAIIEEPGTTIVIPPFFDCKVDDFGNYHMTYSPSNVNIDRSLFKEQITLEIIESSLQAIATEMFAAIKYTAMSSIIYEVLDMGTAITDGKGNLATSGTGIPAFVGALDKAIQKVIDLSETIENGDIFVLNDPYNGGITHLNDILIVCPVFIEEELLAWTANIAHWNDVSGKNQGSMSPDATELFQEGIIIPPVKLFQNGKKNDAVFKILKANTRMPDFQEGDLWAQISAVKIGEKRIVELIEKYGSKIFKSALNSFFLTAEAMSRKGLLNLPQGSFEIHELQENGLEYSLKIEINSEKVIIDLRENPDQLNTPFNLTREASLIPAQLIFKSIISPNTPVSNAGFFKPLEVLTRPGSIFHAKHPAPQGFYFETVLRLYDMIWKAFAEKLPNLLPAGHFGSICGTVIGGIHPDTGKMYSITEPELGGWGASMRKDGNSAIFSAVNGETYNCPVEISEARNGLFVESLKLNEGDGGEGEKTGGKGICMKYVIKCEEAFVIALYTRSKIPAWGMNGGKDGSGNFIKIWKEKEKTETVYSEINCLKLRKNDIVEIMTGNGGGWGNPLKRDRKLVEEDLKNGYINREQAVKYYGF